MTRKEPMSRTLSLNRQGSVVGIARLQLPSARTGDFPFARKLYTIEDADLNQKSMMSGVLERKAKNHRATDEAQQSRRNSGST